MKNKDLWKKIYRLTAELYRLKPWNVLDEEDIFGVRTSSTGTRYFVCVMGSIGQFMAINALEGDTALQQFWDFYDNLPDDPERVLTIPHMMLSYHTKDEIHEEQLKQIKNLDLDFGETEEWPEITRIIPGFVPVTPDDERLADMAEILEQLSIVCSRAILDNSFIFPEEDDVNYFFREAVRKNGKITWRDTVFKVNDMPMEYNMVPDTSVMDEIKSLHKAHIVFQVDLRMLPYPVREEDGTPTYYSFVALLVNKKSWKVEGFKILKPFPDYSAMVASVPMIIADFIKELRFRPRCIEVKKSVLHDLLCTLLQETGIKVIQAKTIEPVEEVFEDFLKYLDNSQVQ